MSTDPCIIIQRNDTNSVVLHASMIVNPKKMENLWQHKYFQDGYLPGNKQKPTDQFTHYGQMATFPFPVSGIYIDQAASQLVFLGHPLFNHFRPDEICSLVKSLPPKHSQRNAIINGWLYYLIDQKPRTEYFARGTYPTPSGMVPL